jgi:hypothetical protein
VQLHRREELLIQLYQWKEQWSERQHQELEPDDKVLSQQNDPTELQKE